MNDVGVYYLALILAKSAELEGMKAENLTRDRNGAALAYDDAAFAQVSRDLEELAAGVRAATGCC